MLPGTETMGRWRSGSAAEGCDSQRNLLVVKLPREGMRFLGARRDNEQQLRTHTGWIWRSAPGISPTSLRLVPHGADLRLEAHGDGPAP